MRFCAPVDVVVGVCGRGGIMGVPEVEKKGENMGNRRRWWAMLVALCALVGLLGLTACGSGGGAESTRSKRPVAVETSADDVAEDAEATIDEDGTYTSKEDVALYLHEYGHLPSNFVTKDEAEDAGWKTEGLSLDEACPGMSIGGDRFGNREKRLPTKKGRTWYECDIDYTGGSRGAKRIVYSSDGLIYYTKDHYKSFERLY